MRWPLLLLLVVLIQMNRARSHRHPPEELFCTNDFVNNVSCVWTGSWSGLGSDCRISGQKYFWILKTKKKNYLDEDCTVHQQENSPPGCSFVFAQTKFSGSDVIPNINMTCDGRLIQNLTEYRPRDHIKMHPPEAPRINRTVNDTWISWNLTGPVSDLFRSEFDFIVQVKRSDQSWAESMNLSSHEQNLKLPVWDLKGLLEIRVKVRPVNRNNSHWSDWSPTTSWEGEMDNNTQHDWISLTLIEIFLVLIFVVVVLILYKSFRTCRHLEDKPVPNPSKFFKNLNEEDLKKWLNPLSAPESFIVAPPCDISPVDVCESGGAGVPSPSSSYSYTNALLHSKNPSSYASDSSGIVDNSSSLSSFSNMGYFMSSSSSGSAGTNPNPAYFLYHDLPDNHIHHPSLFDEFSSGTGYESLKREPESPDSGFGIMEDDDKDTCPEHTDVVNNPSSHFLLLPLNFPMCSIISSSPAPPPSPPPGAQISDSEEEHVFETAAAGSTASMCRSSSMPTEPFKSDYMTLKELQATFSNKSI
nr:LOW QUALITY PROTEIN: interleukin-2 receptor subunit beta [Nothobranchius furzeri]